MPTKAGSFTTLKENTASINVMKKTGMNFKQLILFFNIVLLIASCSNTKNLGANQNLFVGSDEKIKSTDKLSSSKRKGLESEMHELVRPKPNTTVLGVRFKLTVFNMFKEPKKKKGIIHWLKYKVGEPPVLASNSALEKNRQVIQNHFDNNMLKGHDIAQMNLMAVLPLIAHWHNIRQRIFSYDSL